LLLELCERKILLAGAGAEHKTGGSISDSTIRTRQSETWWWTGGGVAVEVAENISYASSLVGSVRDSKQEHLALYVCAGRTRSRRHVNVEGPTLLTRHRWTDRRGDGRARTMASPTSF